jgi:hypothetical protein
LAQLAGDEIERLLAETETERPAPASAAAVVAAAPASPTARDTSATAPLPAEVAAADAPAAGVADPKENLAAELDTLFKSLDAAATPPAAAPLAAAPPPPASGPSESKTPPVEAAETATSSAELKALSEPIAATDSAAALDATLVAEPAAEPIERGTVRLVARIFGILSSPLGHCSDSLRQKVGKVAIATLLNAIAVLAYTLIFRHR